MNCPPEHSGCWFCMTDFDSPLGWYESDEFDCVLHVECIEYEHNENRNGRDHELDLMLLELDYMTKEEFVLYESLEDKLPPLKGDVFNES